MPTRAPSHASLAEFVEFVANSPYDGRPCAHAHGCHDHETCASGCSENSEAESCRCPFGGCCDPVEMGFDETHDLLVDLVTGARELLGLPSLFT